jgi:hypothetical protein
METAARYGVNRQNVVYEIFEDEVVIINLETGNYYSFDGVGVDIWNLIRDGASTAEIHDWVISQYEGSTLAEIAKDIDQSILELHREGLIVPIEESESETRISFDEKTKSEKPKPLFQKPALGKYTDMQDFLLVDPIHEVDYSQFPKKKKPL